MQAKWKDRGFRYLGITFAEQLQFRIQDNVGDLMGKLNQQMKRWVPLPLSWLGLTAVIQMNVLPRILFHNLHLNLAIPEKRIKEMQPTINELVWKNNPARIKAEIYAS